MTWELLYKVGEVFILIYINNTKYKIYQRFECNHSIKKKLRRRKFHGTYRATLSFHDTKNAKFINYGNN